MSIKSVLKVLIVFLLLGCARINRNDVYMEFDNDSRQLTVHIMASAIYMTKMDTIVQHDTLKLFVYEKPVFLTFQEKKKKASRIITVGDNIHFIEHRDSVYLLTNLQHPK